MSELTDVVAGVLAREPGEVGVATVDVPSKWNMEGGESVSPSKFWVWTTRASGAKPREITPSVRSRMRPSRPARRTERRSSMGLSGRGFAHSRMGTGKAGDSFHTPPSIEAGALRDAITIRFTGVENYVREIHTDIQRRTDRGCTARSACRSARR